MSLLTELGEAVIDGFVGALEGAVHRCRGRLERLGDLGAGEAEHVTEDQHRPLAGRQMLERPDECDLDTLSLLVTGLRSGKALVEAEPLVGVRLDAPRRRP